MYLLGYHYYILQLYYTVIFIRLTHTINMSIRTRRFLVVLSQKDIVIPLHVTFVRFRFKSRYQLEKVHYTRNIWHFAHF